MKLEQQVPRNALVWMILSLFTLLAPHIARIPIWVLAVYLVAAVWRIMVYRGRWSFPSRVVKIGLIVAGSAGIYISFGTLLGLEPTVALLLTAFAFKLIELASRKDAYVLLFLGYFICLLEFLFSQDLPIVLYSTINVVLVTTALVALHQPGQHQFNRRSIRQAGVMLLQAVPLALVLFFLFPRLGPLWTVPMKSHAATTGVSDFMKPGDISNLSQSGEVAFRVQFSGRTPTTADLYWRGIVMSRLTQGAWRSVPYQELPVLERRANRVRTRDAGIEYSVIMEPTQQRWLYSLDYSLSGTTDVIATADYLLYSRTKITDQFHYQVRSWDGVRRDPELSDWRRRLETSLPGERDPRTRELARSMRREAGSDEAFMRAALRRFGVQPFHYTMQPPLLTEDDAVDQFMFTTQRGFCEHFASAFVVMMRAAGVPARVVAGYQGGELNPVNNTIIVHQFDAHAWAEVWLPEKGWVRADPTAEVAPGRIHWGLETALGGEGGFLSDSPLSPMRYRGVAWLNDLRLRYDALTYQWQRLVIGFDTSLQFNVLERVLGEVSARKFATVFLFCFALVLVPVAISLLFRRRTQTISALDRQYLSFCDRVAARGISRLPGETPDAFAERACEALPELDAQLKTITRMYARLAYADADFDPHRKAAMLRDLKFSVRRFGKRQARSIV